MIGSAVANIPCSTCVDMAALLVPGTDPGIPGIREHPIVASPYERGLILSQSDFSYCLHVSTFKYVYADNSLNQC